MEHTGSAYLSTKRQIEDAEDRGERRGIARGIELAAEMHEREGDLAAAARLREAKIVTAENGEAGE